MKATKYLAVGLLAISFTVGATPAATATGAQPVAAERSVGQPRPRPLGPI